MEKNNSSETFKYAFKRSLPVMAGYVVLGAGFGILLNSKGYGIWYALAMSVFIFAGSMQYVAIDLISGGATLIAAALMTLMVNARHLFYGVSMIEKYSDTKPYKPYLIFALTDETYSIVCGDVPKGLDKKKYLFYVSLLNQLYWIIGSAVGSLAGGLIGFDMSGIEFSMTALFIVVFIEQLKSGKNYLSAVIGVAASVICLLIFGADGFIIPSMISITALLALFGKRSKNRRRSGDV